MTFWTVHCFDWLAIATDKIFLLDYKSSRNDATPSNYEGERATTYEVSCYTDPLGIEHLTGSLAECIRYFGTRENAYLRWVTKFDNVESLLNLPHNGHIRCRVSVNADPVSHFMEGGTAAVENRLQAIRQLALSGYPVGIVIAPIMAIADWQRNLLDLGFNFKANSSPREKLDKLGQSSPDIGLSR